MTLIGTINNGEIRLTNGLHKYAGRVEMYWNSEWRTVCHDGWNERDAQVVCRELSYLSTSIQVLGIIMDNTIIIITKGMIIIIFIMALNNYSNFI